LMAGGFTGSCTDLQLGRYEYQRSLPQRSWIGGHPYL
jgi:hypothetical protein